MLPLWLQLTRNNDQPDLIVADDTYFTLFDGSQTSIQRYTNTTDIKAGTTSLKYKGADVVYDSLAAGMPDAHMYFLNTDYIGVCAHRDANRPDGICRQQRSGVVVLVKSDKRAEHRRCNARKINKHPRTISR